MSNKIKRICCVFGLLISVLTSAHADVFEDTFRDFSYCDAGIFRTLNRETAAWKLVAPLENIGKYSWIKVKNRYEQRDNNIDFSNFPTVGGLKLLSYFDEISDLNSMGLYLYWGFLVSGNVEDVVQKLKPLIHSGERLRRDDGSYARTEIKVLGSRWIPLATSSNTAVGLHKIERVFLIEPHETRKDVVRVSCSLQGGVTADILQEIRPDIIPKDYPKQLSTTLFDDVQIPESVAKVAHSTNWIPKFKKLSYTYIAKTANPPRESSATIEMEVQDGLVRVKEIYSPNFNVQRLMLAGLVQLKAHMNGVGDGRVVLTTDLNISLPAILNKGAKLSAIEVMRAQPPKVNDKEMRVSILCDVVDEVGAETVFSTLTGRAFGLSCTSDNNDVINKKVFIEDLGIIVHLDEKSKFGEFTYQLVRFEIQR